MRMKEDAMKNGQLKPAYNLQYGVEASFIVWAGIYPNPTDTRTLIPFLEDFHAHIGKRSRKLVADAGYESEENYLYLREKGQTSYIKPNNYEVQMEAGHRAAGEHDLPCGGGCLPVRRGAGECLG